MKLDMTQNFYDLARGDEKEIRDLKKFSDIIFGKTVTTYSFREWGKIKSFRKLSHEERLEKLVKMCDGGRLKLEDLEYWMTEEDRKLWKGYLLGKRLDLV